MKPWSIRVSWTERDDDGKPFQTRAIFQLEAKTLSDAYTVAENAKWDRVVKFGAILPGHHSRF